MEYDQRNINNFSKYRWDWNCKRGSASGENPTGRYLFVSK